MRLFVPLIFSILLLGCGGSSEIPQEELQLQELTHSPEDNDSNTTTQEQSSTQKDETTVTIYVHGYSPSGANKIGTYGINNYEDEAVAESIIEVTGYPTLEAFDKENDTNVLAIASYYGSVAPDYYSLADKRELRDGEMGIPRYALIIAKFAKEMMQQTDADNVQFISVSMGSLVTRYLIEKDLENLASTKKIKKWLSLEGVITGNIAASADNLSNIVGTIQEQSIDVDHLHYSWILENLGSNRTMQSPYYKEIQTAFQSSTDDADNAGALSFWLHITQNFQANDGYQVVSDTHFSFFEDSSLYQDLLPAHTFFHETHTSLPKNPAALAYAATFLESSKRVRITLLEATILDLHEDDILFGTTSTLPAEIVFESKVFSNAAMQKWGFEEAIDERLMRGSHIPIHLYHDKNQTLTLDQTLFDSYILDSEENLTLTLAPIELDNILEYGLSEITGHGDSESLGREEVSLPLVEGVYPLQSTQWSGKVQVELLMD